MRLGMPQAWPPFRPAPDWKQCAELLYFERTYKNIFAKVLTIEQHEAMELKAATDGVDPAATPVKEAAKRSVGGGGDKPSAKKPRKAEQAKEPTNDEEHKDPKHDGGQEEGGEAGETVRGPQERVLEGMQRKRPWARASRATQRTTGPTTTR